MIEFFSVSGIACAAHTPETKEIWSSWQKNKSDRARQAILRYAQDKGFTGDGESSTEEAFCYLLSQFPDIKGVKSFILRTAIISYS